MWEKIIELIKILIVESPKILFGLLISSLSYWFYFYKIFFSEIWQTSYTYRSISGVIALFSGSLLIVHGFIFCFQRYQKYKNEKDFENKLYEYLNNLNENENYILRKFINDDVRVINLEATKFFRELEPHADFLVKKNILEKGETKGVYAIKDLARNYLSKKIIP